MKITQSDKHYLYDLTPDQEENIKTELTFANPKHLAAIKFQYSTKGISETIKLYQQSDGALIVPRGIDLKALGLIPESIEDKRHTHPIEISTTITPRLYQERAIKLAIAYDSGVIVAPTGAGKTVLAIELAARLGQRCLILVKSLDLARQWQAAIKQFTELDCGLIGGGKHSEGEKFTVGLIQSLCKHDVSQLDYGLVIVDECHNVPARQAYAVINGINALYKFGLSATPQRRDNLEFMIHAALGEVVSKVEEHELDGKVLPAKIYTRKVAFTTKVESWQEFLSAIVTNKVRNCMLIKYAIKLSQRAGTIILCAQIEHCELLGVMAREQGLETLVIHGQLPAKVRAERMAHAANNSLIIGTYSLLSEGIDWPHLTNLIMASPLSAKVDREDPAATRLIQSIGRIRRPYEGKLLAIVLDIVDNHPLGLSAFEKRSIIYEQQNFEVVHMNS